MEKGNKNARVWKIVAVVLLMAALVCAIVACAGKANQESAEEVYEDLAGQTTKNQSDASSEEQQKEPETSVESSESSEEPEPEEESPYKELEDMGVPIPEKEINFSNMQENVNEDIYAWIYIPDTAIDYPVLQHPTDNTYYLNYNLDGSRGYPGCIYTEDYNKKDFSDPVTVMYGHNMKDGSMFAGLHKFVDNEYFTEHPYVYVYTPDGMLVYQIFAAYEYTDQHLLYTYDFSDKEIFAKYIEKVKDTRSMGAIIDEEVEVDTESHILTLSTCMANKPNNRFLVQGVLLNAD